MRRRLKPLRHLVLVLFFLALGGLEVGHGVFRIATLREDERSRLVQAIEREHAELAHRLRSLLSSAREHAAYLARTPAVREVLALPPDDDASPELVAHLLAYLVSFRDSDRLRILDAKGKERLRCERMGRGVGALPAELLDPRPDKAALELTRALAAGDVILSSLEVDSERVEVPESDRQVLHYLTPIDDGGGRAGVLALTVYAAPLLDAVREFAPAEGVVSFLTNGDGDYLASADRSLESRLPGRARFVDHHPDAARAFLEGRPRFDAPGGVFLGLGISDVPSWRIVTWIPRQVTEAASASLSGEYLWITASMVAITLVLIVAGAFFLRLSVREVRLEQAAREKELERQLQLSERLGSLGLLTAGVAHEINNPLEGIGNYLALLEREPLSSEKRARYLELVRYGFHRIRNLVRDLSAFARPAVSTGTADLSRVVERAVTMVSYARDFRGVVIDRQGLDVPVVIPGDAGRLEQVVINLLLNSARVMDGRGTIHLAACRIWPSREVEAVELVVEDSGPGMRPELLDRIFDPFFTTSGGTGLGLSISYSIIRAHDGTMRAENRPEGGARFVIRLPACRKELASAAGSSVPEP